MFYSLSTFIITIVKMYCYLKNFNLIISLYYKKILNSVHLIPEFNYLLEIDFVRNTYLIINTL